MDRLDRLGRLILELHRGARTVGVDGFIGWALDSLARELPFDSALWGTGHVSPQGPVAHTLTLHHQPAGMMADYAGIQHHDRVFAQSVRQPGRTLAARVRDWVPAEVTPYLERYGIEQALNTIDIDPVTSLLNNIALWRRDRERPFSEDDRRFMQAAFPHLTEACTGNRLAHLVTSSGPRPGGPWQAAAADRTGMLHHADTGFAALVLREWPGWCGPHLPAPICAALAAGGGRRVQGDQVVVALAPASDLVLVQLREAAPIDRLTAREREVANLAAQGHSHKQIARLLDLAPATVRNHLAAACRRLGVHRSAQLAALVQQHR